MIFILILYSLVFKMSSARSDSFCFPTIGRSVKDDYIGQPMFVNFAPMTPQVETIDNICHTYFPLPDDPHTFQLYVSRVFCDGSNDIMSQIVTQMEQGVTRKASVFCTFNDYIFGYGGCDTYLVFREVIFGSCTDECITNNVYGVSEECRPMGLSCLGKIEEIMRDIGMPEQNFYVFPMNLPNRCVNQQICLKSPNPFVNTLSYHQPSTILC